MHSQSGVTDFVVKDEVAALRKVRALLNYLPSYNGELAPHQASSDPITRKTWDIDILLKKAFNSPTGFNTPIDVTILIQQLCDHGDFMELQPDRARNTVTALGRMGGNVIGFVANNSSVSSGQIDIDAAYKNARFIRFCNLYNIPVIFLEDTTGFLPGKEQESRWYRAGGPGHAGRDRGSAHTALPGAGAQCLRRCLRCVQQLSCGRGFRRCAAHHTRGRDGPGRCRVCVQGRVAQDSRLRGRAVTAETDAQLTAGLSEEQAAEAAAELVDDWVKSEEALLAQRYERELMNPNEALSLGSISQIVMPSELRQVLAENMAFYLRRYQAEPAAVVQREFH